MAVISGFGTTSGFGEASAGAGGWNAGGTDGPAGCDDQGPSDSSSSGATTASSSSGPPPVPMPAARRSKRVSSVTSSVAPAASAPARLRSCGVRGEPILARRRERGGERALTGFASAGFAGVAAHADVAEDVDAPPDLAGGPRHEHGRLGRPQEGGHHLLLAHGQRALERHGALRAGGHALEGRRQVAGLAVGLADLRRERVRELGRERGDLMWGAWRASSAGVGRS